MGIMRDIGAPFVVLPAPRLGHRRRGSIPIDRRRSRSMLGVQHARRSGGKRWMARRLDTATLGDHLDRLYRAAWALTGSREDAEDLVQDTYARVLARPRFLRR